MAIKKGNSFPNSIVGTSLADQLFGFGGNDTLTGSGGHDLLDGGTGTDRMSGGTGNDTYVVDRSTDRVIESAGQGTDTVRSSVTLTIGTHIEHLILTGTKAINGTLSSATGEIGNSLTGNSAANVLKGGLGHDVLIGGLGSDRLEGGNGNDTLLPGAGLVADTIIGGNGLDTIDYRDADGPVQVWLGLAITALRAQGDLVSLVENVTGSRFGDLLMASATANSTAFGGAGNDRITGSLAVYDRLRGDEGNDELVGSGNEEDFWLQYDKGMDFVIDYRLGGQDHVFIVASEFGLSTNPNNFISGAEFDSGDPEGVPDASNFSGIVKLFFDTSSRILWADRDGGAGPGAPVAIALFDNGSAPPTAADIFVV